MKNVIRISLTVMASFIFVAACGDPWDVFPMPDSTVAGYEAAREEVLRQIPASAIEAARTGLHVAYQHTSHGTHVPFGLFGLEGYKAGDSSLFGVTDMAATPDPAKLDFHDYYGDAGGLGGSIIDLSNGVDTLRDGQAEFVHSTRSYLDDAANADINVVMWSWCSIGGHTVQNYLDGMKTLIDEYGQGGSKIGTGPGDTRTTPVSFIFMTGHAEQDSNLGAGRPRDQAAFITDFCEANGYWCLDYFSIESHAMDGSYYEDVGEDGDSTAYGGNFFIDWQAAHAEGVDWYENLYVPGGVADTGAHLTQHITSNRKAYAMWYLLARIAGWDGRL